MIGGSYRLEGVESVLSMLQAIPDAFDTAARDLAITFRNLAKGRTPVDTSLAKRSWGQVEKVEGGYSFTNPIWYTHILEKGLYPGVGPRTVAFEGGIYSSQAPGGILEPLIADQELLRRAAEFAINTIIRGMESART